MKMAASNKILKEKMNKWLIIINFLIIAKGWKMMIMNINKISIKMIKTYSFNNLITNNNNNKKYLKIN